MVRWWRLALLALAVGCGGPPPAAQLPGAPPTDPTLSARLARARQERAGQYEVRSLNRHPDGEPRFINRLVLEDSPYLLQHAHNPVNWFTWGDEAFAEAKRLGRPVLLSIGYSTCHWCHVMEEESFDDERVARLINERYVAIKVDREERPDLDGLYMAAVIQFTGSGGWPMTVWLTPDRAPFWGGTYFPPNDGDRGVARGFVTLLTTLADTFAAKPAQAIAASQDVIRRLQAAPAPPTAAGRPDAQALDAAVAAARARFDATNGGLRAPRKFPSTTPIRALLRYHRRTQDAEALRMATTTLDHMAAGGMRDQLGGGFHRYATDPAWRVPHFEIMLYDNALLAIAYLEAYQATGTMAYADVARGILEFLATEMQAPKGGFWSATDADSPDPDGRRTEGWFFTWTPGEILGALGDEPTAAAAQRYFGVSTAGDVDGRSVLRIADPTALDSVRLRDVRERLKRARERRPRPPTDHKLITAWNGLAISAFARAAVVLATPSLAATAARSADVLLARIPANGIVPRRVVGERAGPPGTIDDYACLTAGLLDLFEATGSPRWLAEARRIEGLATAEFHDPATGSYFLTAASAEALPVRERPLDDGAEPAGNSVMALNLLRLAALTNDSTYRQRAEGAIAAASGRLGSEPLVANELLLALDFQLDAVREIVLAVSPDDAGADPFLDRLRARFLPNRVIVTVRSADAAALTALTPLAADKPLLQGRTTAYVCERHVCALPTTDPGQFAAQLTGVRPLHP